MFNNWEIIHVLLDLFTFTILKRVYRRMNALSYCFCFFTNTVEWSACHDSFFKIGNAAINFVIVETVLYYFFLVKKIDTITMISGFFIDFSCTVLQTKVKCT